jgi:hypothetical protein
MRLWSPFDDLALFKKRLELLSLVCDHPGNLAELPGWLAPLFAFQLTAGANGVYHRRVEFASYPARVNRFAPQSGKFASDVVAHFFKRF